MSTPLLLVLLAAFGLVIGSFLNVMIVRVPSGESILRPPSKCPQCEDEIARRDNIPVVSWVLLKGRCRSCGEPIPAGYPLVELGNAALWVAAGLRFGDTWPTIPFALFFSVLLALSVIDLELYILPNKITYPSVVVSLVAIVGLSFAFLDDPAAAIRGAVIGGVGYSVGLGVTVIAYELIIRKEGMGMGDVKLAALLGLWIGFVDPILVLYGLILACFLGIAVGAVILVIRRASEPYPFGPWLALGAIVVILFSTPILDFVQPDQPEIGSSAVEVGR